MKKDNECLTVGELKNWLSKHNIQDNTPIGIYIGDSERGSVALGIIGETKEFELSELNGKHCYCKDCNPLQEAKTEFMVMITDGCHHK